jgi:hypothetical protein
MNNISLNSNWKFELNKSMEKIKLYCCGESVGKVVARGKPMRQRTRSRGDGGRGAHQRGRGRRRRRLEQQADDGEGVDVVELRTRAVLLDVVARPEVLGRRRSMVER